MNADLATRLATLDQACDAALAAARAVHEKYAVAKALSDRVGEHIAELRKAMHAGDVAGADLAAIDAALDKVDQVHDAMVAG